MPRSGNVLLLRYLHAYYAPSDFRPNDFLLALAAKDFRIPGFHSRTHDASLTERYALDDTLTIIQHRDPADCLASLLLRQEAIAEGTISKLCWKQFERYIGQRAAYFIEFCRKWAIHKNVTVFQVPYQDLVRDPQRVLCNVIIRTGGAFSAKNFERIRFDVANYKAVNTPNNRGSEKSLASYNSAPAKPDSWISPSRLGAFGTFVRGETQWMHWNVTEQTPSSGENSDLFLETVTKVRQRYFGNWQTK